MVVRFGRFGLDRERRELRCGAKRLHLPPKALQLLEILVDRRPAAVAQQELYDLLWPETFVERTNIHDLIYQIRKALGDEGAEIIRTVYGFGFSFAAAAVDDVPKVASWSIHVGDAKFELHDGENVVGRESDVAVRLDAPSVSRRHARLIVSAEGVSVEDMASKNGTSVNGIPIHATTPLVDGDNMAFGIVTATLRARRRSHPTERLR